MTQEIINSFRNFALAAAIGTALGMWSTAGHAYTEQQRIACTPDVYRLCSSQIPSFAGVKACLLRNKSNLSSACRAEVDKALLTVAASSPGR